MRLVFVSVAAFLLAAVAMPVSAHGIHFTRHHFDGEGQCHEATSHAPILPPGWTWGECPDEPEPTPTVEPSPSVEPTPEATPEATPEVVAGPQGQGGSDQGPGGDCEKSTDPGACGGDHSNTVLITLQNHAGKWFKKWFTFIRTCQANDPAWNWIGVPYCDNEL